MKENETTALTVVIIFPNDSRQGIGKVLYYANMLKSDIDQYSFLIQYQCF